jgi:hypothetical protein
MSRHVFGNGSPDWLFTVDATTTDAEPSDAINVIFYDALTAGNAITDLLDNTGTPITAVTTDANGFLPEFSGPDTSPAAETRKMAADANGGAGPRVWIQSTDMSADIDSAVSLADGAQASANSALSVLTGAPMFVFAASDLSWPSRPSTTRNVIWINTVGAAKPALTGAGGVKGDTYIGP